MPEFLKYYMWGYQPHFHISVSGTAERLFGTLDPELKPRVFLVGFRTDDDSAFEPICLEPEDVEDAGYDVSYFAEVPKLAAEIEEEGRDEGRLHSHPLAQERYEAHRRAGSWAEATRRVLDREDTARGWRSFVGYPVEVNNFQVICVLQLPRVVYDSYPQLVTKLVDDRISVHSSFVESVVDEFLRRCGEALRVPNAGASLLVIDRSNEEMLRHAGRRFVSTAPAILGRYDLLEALYDALSELAAIPYEGEANHGQLLLVRPNHPHLEIVVRLQREISLMEARATRKLLEISMVGNALLADGAKAYGLGHLLPSYDPAAENAFLVEFTGDATWHLSHAGIGLLRVRSGVPALPAKPPSEARLVDTLERVFGTSPGTNVPLLRDLVGAASGQRHGTMVVVSDHAAEEALRLRAQATPIDPLPMTAELMRSVTAIDGAVLLDPGGTCHAMGVILDGMASEEGAPGRGARYNSAVKYVGTVMRYFRHRCVAVVVSQDGPVNVIPELLPRISRAELRERIDRFVALGQQAEVRRRDFNPLTGWLSEHRPYLSKTDAARIEEARAVIEPKLEKADIWLSLPEFKGRDAVPDDLFTD